MYYTYTHAYVKICCLLVKPSSQTQFDCSLTLNEGCALRYLQGGEKSICPMLKEILQLTTQTLAESPEPCHKEEF